MGGLLALLDAGMAGVEEVAAWAPVLPGRRYARSLTLMGERPPADADLAEGSVLIGGYLAPSRLLRDLQTLSLDDLNLAGVGRAVIANRDDQPSSMTLTEAVAGQVPIVETLELPGHREFIDAPAEDAIIPLRAVEALVAAVAPMVNSRAVQWSRPNLPIRSLMSDAVEEEHVVIGRRGTVSVRTAVSGGGSAASTALVFLNTGSDPHYGPSRAWVDLARILASPSIDVFRTDFSGWGDSPPDSRATGRPYDLHVVEDIEAVSLALHETGYERVVFAGLCASAWLALHAARVTPLGGAGRDMVIAINPQLYWRPGDPVEALMSKTRARRAEEIESIAAQADAGIFDAEDAAGRLCDAARWLQDLVDARVPVHLLFAENDDGLIYIRQRIGRRLRTLTEAGALQVTEMPGVDHSMSRIWKRPAVAALIRDALALAPLSEPHSLMVPLTRSTNAGQVGSDS